MARGHIRVVTLLPDNRSVVHVHVVDELNVTHSIRMRSHSISPVIFLPLQFIGKCYKSVMYNYTCTCTTPLTYPQYGQSALHVASHRGHTRVVRVLLNHGADVHAADEVHSSLSRTLHILV